MTIRVFFLILSLVASVACSGASATPVDDAQLAQILADHWTEAKKEQIFFRKDPDTFRMDGKLPDMSAQGRENRAQFNNQILQRLQTINSAELSEKDLVTFKLFQYERETEAASYEQLGHYYPLHYYSSWFSYFAGAPNNMSFASKADYENYLISLADFPRYNQQFLTNLNQAIEVGHTHYCDSLDGYVDRASKHLVDKVQDSVFYAPLANTPSTVSEEDKKRFVDMGSKLITDVVIPEYRKIETFFIAKYMPACRNKIGITELVGGEDYYQYLIKYYTTTDYTAEEIHQIGLDEVARIRADMDSLIKETGFKGNFKAFINFLRTDPQFYTDDPRDLLEKAAYITVKMAGQLPKWFGLMPRQKFDIKPSPDGGAYYVAADLPPPGEQYGTTSGTYFLNTTNLKSEPLYNLEALTFHEAEPGHHFQGSIAQELDVPEFRKTLYHSAYGEGWGLYSEALGKEMGFYQNPYSDFGRLTYEMWRACRLVVDTGMHAQGWSRQKAIDYLADNTALSMADVIKQIDRYITWPAQALSYKIGELKIRELRARAEQTLGPRFDIRAFHDQILGNGSLPLATLEELFDEWLSSQ